MAILTNIGDKFKNICFIGLDRVEYFHDKSRDSITGDTWLDVTDEQSRKNLALVFFSPRDLEGDHMNPYAYLSDKEGDGDIDEMDIVASQQQLQNIPLIDMCRVAKSEPNTVNILIVADVIFHWDVNDSYIQPTSQLSWIQDLKQVQSTYPKSTKFNIYTNWDKEKLADLNLESKPVQALPIDDNTWLNMPTFQEKNGLIILLVALAIAGGAYAITYYQDEELTKLSREIQSIEQDAPNTNKYAEIARKVTEQEAFMRYKKLIPVAFRDVASSIYHSGIEAESFEVRGTQLRKPIVNMLATIKAKTKAYQGWIQEEPIAKSVLIQSVSMEAIRKPPKSKKFELEALINLSKLEKKLEKYQKQDSEVDIKVKLPEINKNKDRGNN